MDKSPLLKRVISEVAGKWSVANEAHERYELAVLENHSALFPEQDAERTRRQIATTTDVAEREKLQVHLSAVEGSSVKGVAHNLNRQLGGKYLTEVAPAIIALTDAALASVEKILNEAKTAETDFCKRWGVTMPQAQLSATC